MTHPELRLFRRDGREFRAAFHHADQLVLSEWAAKPGEEWHKVAEFVLASGELERLAEWHRERSDSRSKAGDEDLGADLDWEENKLAAGDQSELDRAIAEGEAKRVDPTGDEAGDSLPSPKARGAFKRPPA